ncbi:MAG: hypothetical protein AAF942_11215 [Pseudomonadota bacterium]
MSKPKGLLLVTMEPATNDDDEFNAWYDTEHVPERAAITGFLSATRYVCRSGFPRYLALYDLEDVDVLQSDAYNEISRENLSIWTKRAQRSVRGYWRVEGTQLFPGDAITQNLENRSHLTVVRMQGADEERLQRGAAGLAEADANIAQLRLYRNTARDGEHVALLEHRVPVDRIPPPDAFLSGDFGRIDLVNSYAPYWRR